MIFALWLLLAPAALAIDAPHDDGTVFPGVCAECHLGHNGGDFLGTYSETNLLCLSCHGTADGDGAGADTADNPGWVSTHDGTKMSSIGPLDCTECHDPHTQTHTSYPCRLSSGSACGNGPSPGYFIADEIDPDFDTDIPAFTVSLSARTGTSGTLADGAGVDVCEGCHTQTGHYRNASTGPIENSKGGSAQHNTDTDCITCHSHRNDNDDGFAGTGGNCISCHNQVRNGRRNISDTDTLNGDYDKTYPHVNRTGGVNSFDCVVCHMEGTADGSLDSTFHNADPDTGDTHTPQAPGKGMVELRDVDDSDSDGWNYWTWSDPDSIDNDPVGKPASCTTPHQRTAMTIFCITCHDRDGVGNSTFIAAVNTADTGNDRYGTDPFGYGAKPMDVNKQFQTHNYSSHSISCLYETLDDGVAPTQPTILMTDGEFAYDSGWTRTASSSANGGSYLEWADRNSSPALEVNFTVNASSDDFYVWVAGTGISSTQTFEVTIDGTTDSASTPASGTWSWTSSMGPFTLSAGMHNILVVCTTGTRNHGCGFDGLVISHDSTITPSTDYAPYATTNWGDGNLDVYDDTGTAPTDVGWGSGWSGMNGAGVKCGAWSGSGTCADSDDTGPGLKTGWDESATTECADCHMPGSGSSWSANAHASDVSDFLLETSSGTDATIVTTTGSTTSNVVCFKCHDIDSYLDNQDYTRMYEHDSQHSDDTLTFLGAPTASGGANTGIGCFNCHAGSAPGEIHGVDVVMPGGDLGNGPYNSTSFLSGSALYNYSTDGTTFTCSDGTSEGAIAMNLGCDQHGGSDKGATYPYPYY